MNTPANDNPSAQEPTENPYEKLNRSIKILRAAIVENAKSEGLEEEIGAAIDVVVALVFNSVRQANALDRIAHAIEHQTAIMAVVYSGGSEEEKMGRMAEIIKKMTA